MDKSWGEPLRFRAVRLVRVPDAWRVWGKITQREKETTKGVWKEKEREREGEEKRVEMRSLEVNCSA